MSDKPSGFWPACPIGWRVVPIRKCLQPILNPIEMSDDEIYDLVSVRRRNGGMFFRESLPGKKILTKTLQALEAGSFVIARMQIVHGACALTPPKFVGAAISQSYSAFRGSHLCSSEYFSRLAEQPFMTDYFLRCSHGVVIEKMTFQQERWLEQLVCIPPVPEQRRIAEILDTIDETIQATERVIAKLEAARAGLEAELIARCCQVPTVALCEVANVNRGKFSARPRNDPSFFGGDVPFLQTGDVARAERSRGIVNSQWLNNLGRAVSRAFPAETIAVTIAANIGDTAILDRPMCFPDSVVGVEVFPSASTRWIEICLHAAKPNLTARAPQSAQKNINLQDLRPLRIPFPSSDQQIRFSSSWEAATHRIFEQLRCAEKLRHLRSGLAADLLSGRVRTVAV